MPIHGHVADVLGVPAEAVLVPQGDNGEVRQELLLGLLVESERSRLIRGGGGPGQEIVEGGAGVLGVIRAPVRLVRTAEEIPHGGVVRLPSGAEGADDLVVGDLLTQLGELREGQRLHGDAQRVAHGVAHGLDPGLVRPIGVVGEGEPAAAVGALAVRLAGSTTTIGGVGAAGAGEQHCDHCGPATEITARDDGIVQGDYLRTTLSALVGNDLTRAGRGRTDSAERSLPLAQ